MILLPIALMLWMLGWAMSMAALSKEQRNRQAKSRTTTREDLITLMPVIREEVEAQEAQVS